MTSHRFVVALFAFGAVASACSGPAADGRKPVEYSGTASRSSYGPLGGNYRLEWNVSNLTGRQCHFRTTVESTPILIDTDVPSASRSGQSAVAVSPAQYSTNVSTDCGSWSVRFIPTP